MTDSNFIPTGCRDGDPAKRAEYERLERMRKAGPKLYEVCLEASDHLYTKQDMERVRDMAREAIQGIDGE